MITQEAAALWRELCELSTTAFYDAGEQPNDPEGSKQSAIADAAVAKVLADAIVAAEQRGREQAAVIAESFNVTPAFDLPCSPYDRTEAIAAAIRNAKEV